MAAQKVLKKKVLAQVRAYQQDLQTLGIKPLALIVFGSQSQGRQHRWSDIDLCVVSPRFGKDYFQELIMLQKAKRAATVDIEPHPYHPRDLANRWDPLAGEIGKYGIKVN